MNQAELIFTHKQENGICVLVRIEGEDRIAAALFSGAGCMPAVVSGRGDMAVFPWASGQKGIIRRHLRGGMMRRLFNDRYLLCNRPLREFEAHREVAARGVVAPLPLGVRWERRGLWYRGALATELLAGADLDAYLQDATVSWDNKAAMLRQCGALVRHMHDQGVYHADLQLKNIFIGSGGPVLLDFDRARLGASVSRIGRARNLLRLRRSFEKRGWPPGYFEFLVEGYGGLTPPRWLDALYRMKGRLSSWLAQGRSNAEA